MPVKKIHQGGITMKKKTVVIVSLGVLMVLVACLYAGGKGLHHMAGMMNAERVHQMISWKVDDILDEIDAGDAQTDQIHAIKNRLFKHGKALHEDNKDIRMELLAEWKKESPDMEKVHVLVDRQTEVKRMFVHEIANAFQEIHGILTPEQRNELAHLIEEHLTEE